MNAQGLLPGMPVRTADGERVGWVHDCRDDTFEIEESWFFPRTFTSAYGAVDRIAAEEVVLKATTTELLPDVPGNSSDGPVATEPMIASSMRLREAGVDETPTYATDEAASATYH